MTNRERLQNMTTEELAEEFRKFAKCEYNRYVDLPAWLDGGDEEYTVTGPRVRVNLGIDGVPGSEKKVEGVIVDHDPMYGEEYCGVIVRGDKGLDGKYIRAPKRKVEFIG